MQDINNGAQETVERSNLIQRKNNLITHRTPTQSWADYFRVIDDMHNMLTFMTNPTGAEEEEQSLSDVNEARNTAGIKDGDAESAATSTVSRSKGRRALEMKGESTEALSQMPESVSLIIVTSTELEPGPALAQRSSSDQDLKVPDCAVASSSVQGLGITGTPTQKRAKPKTRSKTSRAKAKQARQAQREQAQPQQDVMTRTENDQTDILYNEVLQEPIIDHTEISEIEHQAATIATFSEDTEADNIPSITLTPLKTTPATVSEPPLKEVTHNPDYANFDTNPTTDDEHDGWQTVKSRTLGKNRRTTRSTLAGVHESSGLLQSSPGPLVTSNPQVRYFHL